MNKILLLFLFLCALSSDSFAQRIMGVVVDTSMAPVPYCAVFSSSLNIGSYTNKNGFFEIRGVEKDSLIFQHIAYYKTTIKIPTNPLDSITVTLLPKAKQLPELGISTKRATDLEWLASNAHKAKTWIAPERPGNSYVALVKLASKQDQRIHSVRFERKNKRCDNLVLRLLAFKNQNGAPGVQLLQHSVALDVSKVRDKTLHFDLSAQNLLLPEDGIFIGLELISKDGSFFKACPLSIAISPNPTEGFIRSNLRYPPELWSPALYRNESSFVLNMELGF